MCPVCSIQATHVKKNFKLSNLLSNYLEENPDEKRNQAEIKELEENNVYINDITEIVDFETEASNVP